MNKQNDTPSWIGRLKNRWGITSTSRIILILIVFACTGFTALYAEDLIFRWLGVPEEKSWWVALLIFIFVTLPLYNIFLLAYGFVFGQFRFFWNFEIRFFKRMMFWRKK